MCVFRSFKVKFGAAGDFFCHYLLQTPQNIPFNAQNKSAKNPPVLGGQEMVKFSTLEIVDPRNRVHIFFIRILFFGFSLGILRRNDDFSLALFLNYSYVWLVVSMPKFFLMVDNCTFAPWQLNHVTKFTKEYEVWTK